MVVSRLRHPANLGSSSQEVQFIILIVAPTKEVGPFVNSLHVGLFFMLLLSSADLFIFSPNNSFRNTIRVSNGLDQDQDRHLKSAFTYFGIYSKTQVLAQVGITTSIWIIVGFEYIDFRVLQGLSLLFLMTILISHY